MKPNIMCQSAWVNIRSADWVILEENPNRIWGHTILKNFSEYLGLSLCPWILWKKQSFTSRDFAKLCYTPWNFQGQKAKPIEIPHNFFMITQEIPLLFELTPGISTCYFFNIPGKSISSPTLLPLHVWIFSGIAH